jgi:hypothetical protein
MKKSIILVVMALMVMVAGIYKIDSVNQVTTYDSPHLERIADGVRYDRETRTVYVRGKVATIRMKRIEAIAKQVNAIEWDREQNLRNVKETFADDPALLKKALDKIEDEKDMLCKIDNALSPNNPHYKSWIVNQIVYE